MLQLAVYLEMKYISKIDYDPQILLIIVQNLNKNGLFMADTGNDRRDKRNKKKQGYNANDDEGGSTGCFVAVQQQLWRNKMTVHKNVLCSTLETTKSEIYYLL